MLVSLKWLAEICDLSGIDAPGAAAALTARGLTVDAILEGSDGAVLDVDVPANRPDCLGHLGLARELSAAFGRRLLPRPGAPAASGEPVTTFLRLEIDAPDLCPCYTARVVRGVRIAASPAWVSARLEACGLRAVNNVVDASNLVLLELGHPIHTFDLSRLGGREIRVRRAAEGERLTTLDGIERALTPDMLVIADAARPLALAGVMGGAESEIGPSTRDVLIEAAYFLPRSVRKTARRLGLVTDASQRFERGADPNGVLAAQDMAVRLLAELAGGVAVPGVLEARPVPFEPKELALRPERVLRLLGFDAGRDAIRGALEALALFPRDVEGGAIAVRPPSWRVDLQREADLVEEVARHLGYDRIPESSGTAVAPSPGGPRESAEERCRTLLAHLGFHEAFNYAMLAAGEDSPFVPPGLAPALAISNPIAETLAKLRRSLLPGLLRSADLNLRRGASDVRLFEIGRVFLRRTAGEFPEEPSRAAIAWAGAAAPRHWSGRGVETDFAGAAGIVDALVGALRPGLSAERLPADLEGLHPGRSAAWTPPDGEPFAWCGEVHPDIARSMDLALPVHLAEVDLSRLLRHAGTGMRSAPLPRVPAVTRDLSLVVGPRTGWRRLVTALAAVPAPAPVRFEALDRYQGEPLAPGEVSITVRVILQPMERTLTDVETEAYRKALVEAAESAPEVRLRS
jgi:phenylalanyl-tRNA synthetase beta chain